MFTDFDVFLALLLAFLRKGSCALAFYTSFYTSLAFSSIWKSAWLRTWLNMQVCRLEVRSTAVQHNAAITCVFLTSKLLAMLSVFSLCNKRISSRPRAHQPVPRMTFKYTTKQLPTKTHPFSTKKEHRPLASCWSKPWRNRWIPCPTFDQPLPKRQNSTSWNNFNMFQHSFSQHRLLQHRPCSALSAAVLCGPFLFQALLTVSAFPMIRKGRESAQSGPNTEYSRNILS